MKENRREGRRTCGLVGILHFLIRKRLQELRLRHVLDPLHQKLQPVVVHILVLPPADDVCTELCGKLNHLLGNRALRVRIEPVAGDEVLLCYMDDILDGELGV